MSRAIMTGFGTYHRLLCVPFMKLVGALEEGKWGLASLNHRAILLPYTELCM